MKQKEPSLEDFLDLSAMLTGYDRIDLQGTGLLDAYLKEVVSIVGAEIAAELTVAGARIYRKYRDRENKLEEAVRSEILSNIRLGPVARNVITMWYLGEWDQLPQSWVDAHGLAQTAPSHVVSADAYKESLVWRAIGSHPPGAKQPGYGTWSLPPSAD